MTPELFHTTTGAGRQTPEQIDLFQAVATPERNDRQIPAAGLRPGMVHLTHYGPRAIITVGEEVEHGKRWLVWRWTRAPRADGIDCGYSGVLVEVAETEMVDIEPNHTP